MKKSFVLSFLKIRKRIRTRCELCAFCFDVVRQKQGRSADAHDLQLDHGALPGFIVFVRPSINYHGLLYTLTYVTDSRSPHPRPTRTIEVRLRGSPGYIVFVQPVYHGLGPRTLPRSGAHTILLCDL